jgi:hypothetical protein
VKTEIGLLGGMPRPANTLLFHRIGGFPESRCVDYPEGVAAKTCPLLNCVACGARSLVHDGPLCSQQTVEQTRFAGIWRAAERQGDPFTKQSSLISCRKKSGKALGYYLHPMAQCLATLRINSLLRKVDECLQMSDACQQFPA